MNERKFWTAALLPLVFFLHAFSQTPEKPTPDQAAAELRRQAVEFLRETETDVASLRTLENRISFASEMAGLMWFENEKEARRMYQTVISDFKQLLSQYDAQMIALDVKFDRDSPGPGGFFALMNDDSEKSRLLLKTSKALAVRRHIALSLAEHAPELAFGFFTETLAMIANPELRRRTADEDKNFEHQLIREIAKNDPAKALAYGRKNLESGVGYAHLDLLGKIYEKDAEKGIEFAAEIAAKLKNSKIDPENLWTIGSALRMGADSLDQAAKSGRKAMFAEADLRDLADLMGRAILARDSGEEGDFSRHLDLLSRFAPARAAQVRLKFPPRAASKKAGVDDEKDAVEADAELLAPPVEPGGADKKQIEAMKNLENLAAKDLSGEERAKIVEQSRKILRELPSRQAKIAGLSGLAGQIARTGDRELAAEIMREALALVNPAPKNYRDYMETWLILNGLAESDPSAAFPVLEETIFRLNGTLEAFVKVAEFIDLSGEIVDDGEVQVGAFGGSMIREVTGNLGMADNLIRSLALADFGKMKSAVSRFDRTEIRVLAKMLVLRTILDRREKEAAPKTSTIEIAVPKTPADQRDIQVVPNQPQIVPANREKARN